MQSSSHLNLFVFLVTNAKPLTCCYCNTKLGELIQVEDNVWKSWCQLSLCTEFSKGDAFISLTQTQGNFTLPARTTVEGWYFSVVLFQISTWQMESIYISRNTCSNLLATCKVKVCLPCTADIVGLSGKGGILFYKHEICMIKKVYKLYNILLCKRQCLLAFC